MVQIPALIDDIKPLVGRVWVENMQSKGVTTRQRVKQLQAVLMVGGFITYHSPSQYRLPFPDTVYPTYGIIVKVLS